MADSYSNLMHTDMFQCMKLNVPAYLCQGGSFIKLDMSYDKRGSLEKRIDTESGIPIDITLYDEGIIRNEFDIERRFEFLSKLNSMNIRSISFQLSDSTLPIYSEILEEIKWEHEDNTSVSLSLDRQRGKKKNLHLDRFKGKIALSEEDLLFLTDEELERIKDKIDPKTYEGTKRVKSFLKNYYYTLDMNFRSELMDDYDMSFFAFNYLLANDFLSDKHVLLNGEKESNKARLFTMILNNPYSEISAFPKQNSTQVWSEFIIGDRVYKCSFLQRTIFKNIEGTSSTYPLGYTESSLTDGQITTVRERVKTYHINK